MATQIHNHNQFVRIRVHRQMQIGIRLTVPWLHLFVLYNKKLPSNNPDAGGLLVSSFPYLRHPVDTHSDSTNAVPSKEPARTQKTLF